MKNKFKILLIVLTAMLFAQCSRENPFLIEKNNAGKINSEHLVSDIETLFVKDSVVTRLSEGNLGGEDTKYLQDEDQYLIYSKEGKHLLTIVPRVQHDSTSKIKYVEIMDSQFKTEKGLALHTPFKEINFHYMINKVETSLSSATLYIDELNATISMRKKDIGVNLFDTSKVKLDQIPDMTKINHFTIWFD
ncbi:MAG: hypothetical protein L3J14_05380 [Flavobacteriaceae bacterium]|nr:hypothetical protein [Flavobacteriaceae bacterium]